MEEKRKKKKVFTVHTSLARPLKSYVVSVNTLSFLEIVPTDYGAVSYDRLVSNHVFFFHICPVGML